MAKHSRTRRTLKSRQIPDSPATRLSPLSAGIRAAFIPAGLALSLHSGVVIGGPQGGKVVGGQGSIGNPDANTTVINQQSHNLAVDWTSFNVKKQELVQFKQPSRKANALNRIYDQSPSQIYGTIRANGNVTLMNPNGVYFRPGSRVNVNNLKAGTLVPDPNRKYGESFNLDFFNGEQTYKGVDGSDGIVVNQGLLEAATGGSVSLMGKAVKNEGVILAHAGQVNLVAGEQVTMDFDGDGLIRFSVDKEVLQNVQSLDAQVSNTGEINADGGAVLLKGSAASEVFSKVVNNEGVISAQRIENKGGTVRLVGGGSGSSVLNMGTVNVDAASPSTGEDINNSSSPSTGEDTGGGDAGEIHITADNITNSGTLSANATTGDGGTIHVESKDTTLVTGDAVISATSGTNDDSSSPSTGEDTGGGGKGGTVKVLGDKVGLFDNSSINVSGATGGGEALVGGDFQGSNPDIQNASRTYVGKDVSIEADATEHGDGGEVIVWADEITRFAGSVSAQGGEQSGDGGFVEVSGKESLAYQGTVNTQAENGKTGTLLLDPTNITVTDGGGDALADVDAFADNTNCDANCEIDADLINNALSNVVLQANNDITFDELINIAAANIGLIAQAGNNIEVNAGITITTNGGDIHFESDSQHTGNVASGGEDGTGDIILNDNTSLNSNGGTINLIGEDFIISTTGANEATIDAGTGDVFISESELSGPLELGDGTRELTQAELGRFMNVGTMTIGQATSAGQDGAGLNAINLVMDSTQVLDNAIDFTTAGLTDVVLAASSTLILDQDVTATSLTLNITGGAGATTQGAGDTITATTLAVTGAGTTTLTEANDVDTLAGSTTNTISFTDADGFSIGSLGGITGLTATGSNITLENGAAVTQTEAISSAGLELLGTGDYTLNNNGNSIDTIAGNVTGAVAFTDSNGLDVGTVNTTGLTASSTIDLVTIAGDITLTDILEATGSTATLDAAGAISGAGKITATTVDLDASTGISVNTNVTNATADNDTSGNVSVTDDDGLSISGMNTGGGSFTAVAGGAGNTLVVTASNIDANTGAVSLQADEMTLTGTVTGNAGVTLRPNTAGTAITLSDGTTTAGLDFTAADLDQVFTTGTLTIGANTAPAAGSITITDAASINPANATNLTLLSGADIIFAQNAADTALTSGGVIVLNAGDEIVGNTNAATDATATSIEMIAVNGIGNANELEIDATHATNGLAATTVNGDINIVDVGAGVEGLTIGSVGGTTGLSITTGGAGEDIRVRATSPVDVNDDVTNTGGGDITLAAEGNTDADDLTVAADITASGGDGSINLFAGDDVIHNSGTISVVNNGTININAGVDFNDGGALQAGFADSGEYNQTGGQVSSVNGTITIRATEDITVDDVQSSAGDVAITADDAFGLGLDNDSGSVSEDGDAGVDIVADLLTIDAATGVGNGDAIETTIATLDVDNTISGNIEITESTDDVDVNNLTQAAGSTGDITLVASNGAIEIVNAQSGVTSQTGTVTLNANTTLTINEAITTFGGLVDLDAGTGITSMAAGTITTTPANNAIVNAGAVDIDAGGTANINLAGTIDTTGAENDNDSNPGTNGGNVTINTTDGTITVANVTSSGGAATTVGTQNGGNAGSITLDTGSGNDINLSASTLTANGGTSVGGTAGNGNNINLNDPVVLMTGAVTLSATGTTSGDIMFMSTVDGGEDLAVNTTGNTTFGGAVGNSVALTSVTTDAGGTTHIDGGEVTTTGTQTYNDTVELGATTDLNTTGNDITFNGALIGTSNYGEDLNITLGAGNLFFNNLVGIAAASAGAAAAGDTAVGLGDITIVSANDLIIDADPADAGLYTIGMNEANSDNTFYADSLTATVAGDIDIGDIGAGDSGDMFIRGNAGGDTLSLTSNETVNGDSIVINSNILVDNGDVIFTTTDNSQDIRFDIDGLSGSGSGAGGNADITTRSIVATTGDIITVVGVGNAKTFFHDFDGSGMPTASTDGINFFVQGNTVNIDGLDLETNGDNLDDDVYPHIIATTISVSYDGSLELGDDAIGAILAPNSLDDTQMDGLLAGGATALVITVSATGATEDTAGNIVLDRATSFGSNDLDLTAAGYISDNSDALAYESTGMLTLESGAGIGIDNPGGVGNAGGSLTIDVDNLITITDAVGAVNITNNASVGNATYVADAAGTGSITDFTLTQDANNLLINEINASGTVGINAIAGGIVDNDDTDIDITGNSIQLIASTGIADGDELSINAGDGTNGLAATTATGDINILDTAGGLSIGEITGTDFDDAGATTTDTTGVSTAGGGNIHIRATSPVTVNNDVINSGGGNILLAAEGNADADDLTIQSAANVQATGGNGSVNLYAGDDIIVTTTGEISVVGAGTVNLNAGIDFNDGAVDQTGFATGSINQTAGLIQSVDGVTTLLAAEDVTLSDIRATNSNVAITANHLFGGVVADNNTGAVIEGFSDPGDDIVATDLSISAATGIGSTTDPIEINITNLTVDNTDAGNVNLAEADDVTLLTTFRNQAAGGSLTLATTDGSIDTSTVAVSTSNGDINFTAADAGANIDRTITVGNGGISSDTVAGNINLLAADGVSLAANVDAGTGNVTIDADNDAVDTFADAVGAITQSAGTVSGATLDLDAEEGIVLVTAGSSISADNTTSGNVDIDNTLAGAVTVTSLTNVNGGNILFDNTGAGGVTFETVTAGEDGTPADGEADVTLTSSGGGNLSISGGTATVAAGTNEGDVNITTNDDGSFDMGTGTGTITAGQDVLINSDNSATLHNITSSTLTVNVDVGGGNTSLLNLGTGALNINGGATTIVASGNGADDTLRGQAVANTWVITGANQGVLNPAGTDFATFTDIGTVSGGDAINTDTIDQRNTDIDAGAAVTGDVDVALTGDGLTDGDGLAGDLDIGGVLQISFDNMDVIISPDGNTNDTFTGYDQAAGNAVWTIDGAGGTELYAADGNDIEFSLNLDNSSSFRTLTGNADIDVFNLNADYIGVLEGAGGDDTFDIADLVTLFGTIDGGLGVDVLDIQDVTTPTVTIAGAGSQDGSRGDLDAPTDPIDKGAAMDDFDNINTLLGDVGTPAGLVGPDADTVWHITGTDSGTYGNDGDETAFTNFNITGGDQSDTFFFDGGTIGSIDGGALGEGNTLIGDNAVNNMFSIDGDGSGNEATLFDGSVFGFDDIDNVFGGTDDDTFTINDNVTFTGILAGNGGDDTLTVNYTDSTTWTINGAGTRPGVYDSNDTAPNNTVIVGSINAGDAAVDGSSGTANGDGTLSFIEFETINAVNGAAAVVDTFNIRALDFDLTINARGGDDVFNVTNATNSLDDIVAVLTLRGDADSDTLNVDDSGDADADNGSINATTIADIFGAGGSIDYANGNFIETIDIDLGTGDDTFAVNEIVSTVSVDGNAGDDTFNVGNDLGDLNENPLTLAGGSGGEVNGDTLNADDSGETTNQIQYTLTAVQLIRDDNIAVTTDLINYNTLENLNLTGSNDAADSFETTITNPTFSGDVSITDVETLDGTGFTLGADQLTITNATTAIGSGANFFNTSVNSLNIVNGGPTFIQEANDIDLLDIETGASNFTLTTLNGSITNNTGAAVDITTTGDVFLTAGGNGSAIGAADPNTINLNNVNQVTAEATNGAGGIFLNQTAGAMDVASVDADTGEIQLMAVSSLTAGQVDGADLTTTSVTSTTFNSTVSAADADITTGTTLDINNDLDASGLVTIDNTGLFTKNATNDITADGGFMQIGAGDVNLASNITTQNNDLTIVSNLILAEAANLTLQTGAAGGRIGITGTITGTTGGIAEQLALDSGTGIISDAAGTGPMGDIGTGDPTGLTRLEIDDSGDANYSNITLTDDFAQLGKATGTITFEGNVSVLDAFLEADDVVAQGTFTTAGTLNLQDITNAATFEEVVTLAGTVFNNGSYDVSFLSGNNGTSTFSSGGTTNFNNTSGTVTLGDQAGDIFNFNNGVVNNTGDTNLAGIINTTDRVVSFNSNTVTLTEDTSIISGPNDLVTSTITLGNVVSGGNALTLDSGNASDIDINQFTGDGDFTVADSRTVRVTSIFDAGTVTLTDATDSFIFQGSATMTALNTDANPYNLQFEQGVTVTGGGVTFDNTGILTLGTTNASNTDIDGAIVATAPSFTVLGGTIDSNDNDITINNSGGTDRLAAGAATTQIIGGDNATVTLGSLSGQNRNLTVIADEIDLVDGASTVFNIPMLTLRQSNADLVVGGADNADVANLNISTSDLDALSNALPNVTLGRANFGTTSMRGTIGVGLNTNLTINGSDANFTTDTTFDSHTTIAALIDDDTADNVTFNRNAALAGTVIGTPAPPALNPIDGWDVGTLRFNGASLAVNGTTLIQSTTNILRFPGNVTGTGTLAIDPTDGTAMTIGGTDNAAGQLQATDFSNFDGHLVIGGAFAPLSPLTEAQFLDISASTITLDNLLQTNGPVTLLSGDINLNNGITSGGTVSLVATGNDPTVAFGGGNGDINVVPTGVTLTATDGSIVAGNTINDPTDITLNFGGGNIDVAEGSGEGNVEFAGGSSISTTQGGTTEFNNFLGLFSFTLTVSNVTIQQAAADLLGIEELGFIDTGLFEEDLTLFGRIGTGIALALAQCEEVEGCAPNVTLEELAELIAQLEARIEELSQRCEDGDAQACSLLEGYKNELEQFRAYQVELQEYFAPAEEDIDDGLGEDDFGEDIGDPSDNIETLGMMLEKVQARIEYLESLKTDPEERARLTEITGIELTLEVLEAIIEGAKAEAQFIEEQINLLQDGTEASLMPIFTAEAGDYDRVQSINYGPSILNLDGYGSLQPQERWF